MNGQDNSKINKIEILFIRSNAILKACITAIEHLVILLFEKVNE